MIEEIITNLYRIEIPLPGSPLKVLNSYLIKTPKQNLIIDTGMNREECMNAMQMNLRELGVDLRKTDFFITHIHADHLGLVSNLTTDESTIYFNQPDVDTLDRIRFGNLWEDMINFTRMNGFPERELQKVIYNHPGYKYGLKGLPPFKNLDDGDVIKIGRYQLKCVTTPGHSKGHMCLYEPKRKILVAGDHILNDITPIIELTSDEGNPLGEYLASLDKVYELDVALVLPGHGGIFRNCKERIKELKDHHRKRANEVLSILKKGSQNAYQIASQMKWNIVCDSWDFFPILQKWFAIGEAIAHLKYLEEKGIVRKEMLKQGRIYSLDGEL